MYNMKRECAHIIKYIHIKPCAYKIANSCCDEVWATIEKQKRMEMEMEESRK